MSKKEKYIGKQNHNIAWCQSDLSPRRKGKENGRLTPSSSPTYFSVRISIAENIKFSIIVFRSFDLNHQNQLTYEEVLFGVAAMDPATPHGGPSGELRCRYIFKFYSSEQENAISLEKFK